MCQMKIKINALKLLVESCFIPNKRMGFGPFTKKKSLALEDTPDQ